MQDFKNIKDDYKYGLSYFLEPSFSEPFKSMFSLIQRILEINIQPYYRVDISKYFPFIFFTINDFVLSESNNKNMKPFDEHYKDLLIRFGENHPKKTFGLIESKDWYLKKNTKYIELREKKPDCYKNKIESSLLSIGAESKIPGGYRIEPDSFGVFETHGLINEMHWIWDKVLMGADYKFFSTYYFGIGILEVDLSRNQNKLHFIKENGYPNKNFNPHGFDKKNGWFS